MSHRRNYQPPVIFKADKAPVEQMIDGWCQQQAVLPIETFLVCAIPPWLAVACPQVRRILNFGDPAARFNAHYPLLEESLATARDNQRFAISLSNVGGFLDSFLDMALPEFQICRFHCRLVEWRTARFWPCQSDRLCTDETHQKLSHRCGNFRQVHALVAITRRLQRRILRRKDGSKDTHVILRPDLATQDRKIHPPPPADIAPIHSGAAEFNGSRALVTIGRDYSDGRYSRVCEGEHHISGRNFPHVFVEGVSGLARFALRGPEVSPLHFLPICLVLIDPPVAHSEVN